MTEFTILRDSLNKSQFSISSTINNEDQIFQSFYFLFFYYFFFLEWVQSTNNKIANLGTKWVGQ